MRPTWFRLVASLLMVVLAACDMPTTPGHLTAIQYDGGGRASTDYILDPIVVTVPGCDPYTQLDFSCDEECESSAGAVGSEFQGVSTCGGGGGSGGGGTGGQTSPPPEDPFVDGPILFGNCFVALLGVLAGTAALLPTTDGIYQTARDLDSAERMLQVVVENNGDLQTQALWEFRVEAARNRYNDSIGNFAIASGFTALAVAGAAIACLPAALLPTP